MDKRFSPARQEAIASGSAYYLSPCRNGHLFRKVSDRKCPECDRSRKNERKKRIYWFNPEKARELSRERQRIYRYRNGGVPMVEYRERVAAASVERREAAKAAKAAKAEQRRIELERKRLEQSSPEAKARAKARKSAREKAWREANPDRNRELIRAWNKAHPEAKKAENKRYRSLHYAKIRESKSRQKKRWKIKARAALAALRELGIQI